MLSFEGVSRTDILEKLPNTKHIYGLKKKKKGRKGGRKEGGRKRKKERKSPEGQDKVVANQKLPQLRVFPALGLQQLHTRDRIHDPGLAKVKY